ncbi:hypothetical protein QBC35DRAFT_503634 [Podospora australis]|uniref:ER-bound oxygenase mpaB/mpaB'/Rubber oxygenase catalytic domain-containing protein n=1 Tax=Podospora australis TaxID=1536484 RepID=A0AAN6WS79_9PEZI|nr:hypothetical protein QBC35DRAFT_503634 [Podospora australis]
MLWLKCGMGLARGVPAARHLVTKDILSPSPSAPSNRTKNIQYAGSLAYHRRMGCPPQPTPPRLSDISSSENQTLLLSKQLPEAPKAMEFENVPGNASFPSTQNPPGPTEKEHLLPQHHPFTTGKTPEDLLVESCADLVTWIGGPYAILLQFAAPGIALGSCQHSRFQTDPISRFRRTAAFILAVVHGTEAQKAAICGAIRKQHSFIKGPNYTANDPLLQKWTAATLYAGAVLMRDTFSISGRELSRIEKEGLCAQFGRFATALDMPAEMWPASLDEFEAYFDEQIRTLEITEASQKAADILLRGMNLPWFLLWGLVVMRVLMAVWLPERLRVAYGLSSPDRWFVWMGYTAIVWLIWTANWVMPERLKILVGSWMKKEMARAAEDIRIQGRWMM